jgi:hypothetical protein
MRVNELSGSVAVICTLRDSSYRAVLKRESKIVQDSFLINIIVAIYYADRL